MKLPSVATVLSCAWLLFGPSGISVVECHKFEGAHVERDWSGTVKRFNLHRHLNTPTTKDLRAGVNSSRRLARNAIRTGHERELVPANPPLSNSAGPLIDAFEQTTPLVSEKPRVKVSETSDALPFGENGVFPAFPSGTNDFWRGSGNPTKMWEVVACPVADVEGFLSNPLRCVFGVKEDGSDTGSLLDFFSTIDDKVMGTVMDEAIIPIAMEAIWTFSGLAWLEKLFGVVCQIFDLVETILGIVEDIGGGFGSVFGGIGDAFGAIGDGASSVVDSIGGAFGFRRLQEDEQFATCTGHYTTCRADSNGVDCDACFLEAGIDENGDVLERNDCGECQTCFQPLQFSVPEMDGLCISTADLRDFLTAKSVPVRAVQALYTTMLAHYMKKVGSEQVIEGVREVLGLENDENLVTTLLEVQSHLDASVGDAEEAIFTKIEETCPAPNQTRRRLGEQTKNAATLDTDNKERKIQDFLKSDTAKKAKEYASQKGLDKDNVDHIFSKLIHSLSENAADSFNSKISNKITEHLKEPGNLEMLESLLGAEVEKNKEYYATELSRLLLKEAVDPNTSQLDSVKLREIHSELSNIKALREKMSNHRRLGVCSDSIAAIKNFITTQTIKPLLEELLDNLGSTLGTADTAFSKVTTNPIYADALGRVSNIDKSGLLMSFGLVSVMDPWSAGGAFQAVMGQVVDIFQTIVGYFLFGCDVNGPDCGVLPSQINDVLPIKENRKGDIFMASGCDSEFEGELLWYGPAFDIVSKLLDGAGKSIIEFLNIPINVVKFILDAAAKLFSHMNDVCEYLDDYVQLALVEATHENTRYALHELACRTPAAAALPLQRGYGCDGLDNNCNENKAIDECEEDIFPPEINAAAAILECQDRIFETSENAVDCISGLVSATDDCKEVTVEITAEDTSECSTSVNVKAVAQGCGERIPEDTEELAVELQLDGAPPDVMCGFDDGQGGLTVNTIIEEPKYPELMNPGLEYHALDNCSGELNVTVEVFANEIEFYKSEGMTFLYEADRIQKKAGLYVAPSISSSCTKGHCIKDPELEDSRLYTIVVSAVDRAGMSNSTECTILVVKDETDPLPNIELSTQRFFLTSHTSSFSL